MTEHAHIRRQFDEELSQLRTLVLQMGGLVETQLSGAIDAYGSAETPDIQSIVQTDRKINRFEIAIDDECARIIAMRQPAASDLRLVLGVSKIVTDLERSGDEIKKIAKGVRRIYEAGHVPSQFGIDVRHIAEAALLMMRRALDCFARLDTAEAREVIQADEGLDSKFKSIVHQLIALMVEDPRTISVAIDIIWIARSLERIGDHAKNLAEQVIYVVEGRDIRHKKSRDGTAWQ